MTPYAVGFLTGLTVGGLMGVYLMLLYYMIRR